MLATSNGVGLPVKGAQSLSAAFDRVPGGRDSKEYIMHF
jgi:hypothetical protein